MYITRAVADDTLRARLSHPCGESRPFLPLAAAAWRRDSSGSRVVLDEAAVVEFSKCPSITCCFLMSESDDCLATMLAKDIDDLKRIPPALDHLPGEPTDTELHPIAGDYVGCIRAF